MYSDGTGLSSLSAPCGRPVYKIMVFGTETEYTGNNMFIASYSWAVVLRGYEWQEKFFIRIVY